MDAYEQLMHRLEAAWTTPSSADTRQRASWAEELSDLLEWGSLRDGDAERVVGRLVQVAVTDGDHGVRESALHAVSSAAGPYQMPYAVVAPLAAHVDAGVRREAEEAIAELRDIRS
ncbi:hypothetical protein [Streptomyces tritici]|uniref:hypothetical protein n=1 Tax=Streptomyces tritici TaxID=2054410 RepID=UPI003AEF94DF